MHQHTARDARVLALIVLLLTLLVAADAVAQQQEPVDLVIRNVHVVDVRAGRATENRTVVIDSGMIRRIVAAGEPVPRGEREVDGAGGWLIPGLVDMHAHMRADGMPAWLSTDWLMPLLIGHGVTAVRDMNSDCERDAPGAVCLETMLDWRARIEAGTLTGPRLLSLGSRPFDPPWDYQVTEPQVRELVRRSARRGADFIKVYDRLPAPALAWVVDEARAQGLDVAGHVPLRMTAAEASHAGMHSIEHARDFLFDCGPDAERFRSLTRSNRPTTSQMRAMVDEHDDAACAEAFRALVGNGTWYVPTHLTRRMEALAGDSAFRADPRMRWLPAPLADAWHGDADRTVARDSSAAGRAAYMDFYRAGLELTEAAYRAGVRVLVGTDGGDSYAFPGSGVHDEMAELVKAGLTPAEALRAATLDAAEFLGLDDRFGAVAPGMHADLVLLAGDPLSDVAAVRRIEAVVFRGELIDRARLDALLAGAEAAAQRPLEP